MSNPFEQYRERLWSTVLPTLPESKHAFERRVWALTSICAYGVLISIVYGAVLFVRARRRRKVWVARYAQDGYLTLNKDFFIPFGGAVSCCCMAVYTILQYRLFTTTPTASISFFSINAFRPFSWIPLPLHGYFVAASAAQASLVVSSRAAPTSGIARSKWLKAPSPRVANASFWVGLALISCALILPDIIFTVAWHRVFLRLRALEQHLKTAGAAWSASAPGASLPALLTTSTLYDALQSANHTMCSRQKAVVIALIVVPFFIATLTLVACGLLRSLLRLQIRTRSARHVAQSSLMAAVQTFTSPAPSTFTSPIIGGGPIRFAVTLPPLSRSPSDTGELKSDGEDDNENEKDAPPPAGTKSPQLVAFLPTLPSRTYNPSTPSSISFTSSYNNASWSPRLARPPTVDGVRTAMHDFSSLAEMEKELEGSGGRVRTGTVPVVFPSSASRRTSVVDDGEVGELKRAERELAVCAAVVLFLTLAAAVENTWNVIRVVPTPFEDLSWAEIEASYFLPPFLYALVYCLGPTLMLFNLFFSRSSCSPLSTPPTPFQQFSFPPTPAMAQTQQPERPDFSRRRSSVWGALIAPVAASTPAAPTMNEGGMGRRTVDRVSVAPVVGARAGLGFDLPPLMAVSEEGKVTAV